jgi:predicted Zn-dependent peptidase
VRALEGAAAAVTQPTVPTAAPRPKRNLAMPAIAALALAAIAAGGWWWFNRPSDSVRFPLEKFTLANGLEVVLSPDHASPTFSLTVVYRAGWRMDSRERFGLAHLVQHAVYEGFPNVARGEFVDLIAEAGGSTNGTTTADISYFWTSLAANQLDLALFLESDRMRSLELTQDGLDTARATIIEERSSALSNPYAAMLNGFSSMAFDNFRNQQAGFVAPAEYQRFTLDDVRSFYQSYYVPSNAAIALVGDFDPAKARERIEHYFGSLPKRPAPAMPDIHEPVRSSERRETIAGPGIPATVVVGVWQAPAATDPDWFVLKRVAEVLGGNSAARWTNLLMKTAGVAAGVNVVLDSSAGPNLLTASVTLAPGKDPAQIVPLMDQDLETIARAGIPKDEMERNETDALRRRAFQLVTTLARSQVFAQFLGSYRQIDAVNDWERAERSVTNDDVKRITKKYLVPARRIIVTVMPEGKK